MTKKKFILDSSIVHRKFSLDYIKSVFHDFKKKSQNRNSFTRKKIRLLKNNNSRFGVLRKPLGAYAVKQRVLTLINKTEAKNDIHDTTKKTRLKA